MASKPCLLIRLDRATDPAVREGDHVQAGQPIGKSRNREGLEVSPKRGVVSHVCFDDDHQSWLVFIEFKSSRVLDREEKVG